MADPSTENHYEVLGVQRDADATTIKKAYRKLVLKWHPDKHPEDRDVAEAKIRNINNAYEILSNPTKKNAYDQQCAALERKSRGVKLNTAGISPRMSIPKEFMMSPLGHSDRFLRYQGWNLFVNNRDEVKVDFTLFFHVAKFSLWWLPEVNNMCRIRAAATASAGVNGGINLSFQLAPGQKDESDIQMTAATDPVQVNFIAVPSPTMSGAFRFETAYHPGHFLAFQQPNHIKVVGNVEDTLTTVLDFTLVDYSSMFKFITLEEVLIPAINQMGGDKKAVQLEALRADSNVVLYFQNILGVHVWDAEDFQIYFEGHFAQWDYDVAKQMVRLRSKDEMLAQQLKSAKRPADVAQVLANADENVCKLIPLLSAERVLRVLSQPSDEDATVTCVINRIAATKKMMDALPDVLNNTPNLRTRRLLYAAEVLEAFPAQDELVVAKKQEAKLKFAMMISDRVVKDSEIEGTEINAKELKLIFQFPFNWSDCAHSLIKLCIPIWEALPMLPEEVIIGEGEPLSWPLLLTLLAKHCPLSPFYSLAIAQLLPRITPEVPNRYELILECLKCSSMVQTVLKDLPEKRLEPKDFANIVLNILLKDSGGHASLVDTYVRDIITEELDSDMLVQLAVNATKISCLKTMLPSVCRTLAFRAKDLDIEDLSKVLLAASKAGSAPEDGLEALFRAADEVFTKEVIRTMSAPQIIKCVLAVRQSSEARPLLERLAQCAVDRHLSIPLAQLLLFTQGLIPCLDDTDVFRRVLEFWEQTLGGNDSETDEVTRRRQELEQKQINADQIAKLGQSIGTTKIGREMDGLWTAIGNVLEKRALLLTSAGMTSLADFPDCAAEWVKKVKAIRKADESSASDRSRSPRRRDGDKKKDDDRDKRGDDRRRGDDRDGRRGKSNDRDRRGGDDRDRREKESRDIRASERDRTLGGGGGRRDRSREGRGDRSRDMDGGGRGRSRERRSRSGDRRRREGGGGGDRDRRRR